jgi:hypothetical protein
MQPIAAISGVQIQGRPSTTDAPSSVQVSLLPEAADPTDDAMMLVYALMAKQQTLDMSSANKNVDVQQDARKKAIDDEKSAQQAEQANAASSGRGLFGSITKLVKDVAGDALHARVADAVHDATTDVKTAVDSPKFWSDLEVGAKVVAAAAGVVATAATAGAAGPAVLAIALSLSVGGMAVSETQCLGKYSGDIGLGMELGGVVVTGGGAIFGTAGTHLASVVAVTASATSGAADVTAGTAQLEVTKYAGREADAVADDAQATNQAAVEQQLTNWLLDNLKASQKAERGAMQAIQGVVQQHDATTHTAASVLTRG